MFSLLALALALAPAAAAPLPDWLNTDVSALTQPSFTDNGDGTWTLGNGLISRTFRYGGAPGTGFGTLDFFSHTSQTSLLRAIDCEGYVTLSNATYALGSLIQTGTQFHAYLNRSADGVVFNAQGFDAVSHSLGAPMAPFPWTPGTRGSPASAQWPPPGLQVAFQLRAPASAPTAVRAVAVQLVYELYPGIPLLTKYVTIASAGPAAAGLVIDAVTTETLRLARQYSPWELGGESPAGAGSWAGTGGAHLYVQSDAAHGSQVQWLADGAQPTDPGAVEAVLAMTYTTGPGVVLQGGNSSSGRSRRAPLHATRVAGDAAAVAEFVSFRTFLLVTDTTDAERTGMAVKRLFRLWAPHAQENPIFFHATDTSEAGFRLEVDQMAATGFEMLIYSFGSGFNLETADPAYLAQVKQQIAYAHSKGIEVGGYDLICLDRGHGGYGGNVGDQWDAVADDGSLGEDACFASGWTDKLNAFAYGFINETGLSMLETDGPYGGGSCASTNHSHHLQLSDSVYQQTMQQAAWYAGLRARNVYINQPDNYFFAGGQRTGLGYNEDQYSLPRWQDLTVSRMTVYDQTYAKIPTSGWMFVPLVDYHGGGADAAFEPMSQHLAEYEMALAQYMGAGVAACYRGFRLYDAPSAQAVVAKWVGIYKAHRAIITSDIVHIRRPDGQALDAFMHVNYALEEKAFAVVFNPTTQALNQSIAFPLYYTGLTDSALFSREGGAPVAYALARDYSVTLPVALAPQSVTWFLVTAAAPLAAAAALPATVAVAIGAAVSAPVPPTFVSLSMEIDDAPRYLGAAGSTSAGWVRLMRLLAAQTPGAPGPTLRIGGDSSDYSLWWDPAPAPALPPRQQYAITRADLAAYKAAVTQWGGALVLGSTLFLENNATFAGAHARGITEHLGWGLVDALEVGNEPEGFNGEEALRPRSWGPLDYSREFYAHVLAMRAAGMPGGAFLQGAVFGGNDTAFDGSFANYTSAYAALGVLRSVSRHHYSLSACGGGGAPPTPAALLASVAATRAFLAPFAAAARAAGVEFRVGEYNSAACGGAKGASDTFAASLWALDSLLALASLNATQVNVHGGPHNAYSPIQTRVPSTAPIVMPAFYGMWAAAAALANASVVLAASASGSGAGALLGVHALQEGAGAGAGAGASGALRVVVVHKDPSGSDARVSVAPPPSALATGTAWAPLASLTRLLSAGGVLEQYNISWGGLTFLGTRDGVPVPSGSPASEAVPLVGGLYTFDVPRGSAATLRFARA